MKQLRFRALDRGDTEMYYSTDFVWLSEFFSRTSPGELPDGIYQEGNTFVMRCADKMDTKGKLVWEEDIVAVPYYNYAIASNNGKSIIVRCIVKLGERGFYAEPITEPDRKFRYSAHPDQWEVIGNIHLNPELLKTT